MTRCPECGCVNAVRATRCSECGIYLDSASEMGTGIRILLYIASLFVPLAGIIIGAIYISKPEPYTQVGKICLILGIFGLIGPILCAFLLYVLVLGFV